MGIVPKEYYARVLTASEQERYEDAQKLFQDIKETLALEDKKETTIMVELSWRQPLTCLRSDSLAEVGKNIKELGWQLVGWRLGKWHNDPNDFYLVLDVKPFEALDTFLSAMLSASKETESSLHHEAFGNSELFCMGAPSR